MLSYLMGMQVRVLLLGVLGLAAILAFPQILRTHTAEIIYVQPAATGAGDGSSWDNATTLRDALQHDARAQDEIWIAAGTHYPIVPRDPTAVTEDEQEISFAIPSGVALYGGFAGIETARDQRDPAVNSTTLSGDIDQNSQLDASNSTTVVDVSGTDATTILDGLTITGGNADGDKPHRHPALPTNAGGGIFTVGGSPTLTNVQVVGNKAWLGGGIYIAAGRELWNAASHPAFTDVTISANRNTDAFNGGAGVFIAGAKSRPTFTDVTISTNFAGAGVYIIGASRPTFTDVTISANGFASVFNDGEGVIIGDASTPTFTDVTISANDGDGVVVFGASSAVLTTVTISENGGHGVIIRDASSPTLTAATISENGGHGVIIRDASSPTLTTATISANFDDGVYIRDASSPTFTNVTINDNGVHGMHIGRASTPTCTDVTISANGGLRAHHEGPRNATTCAE